MPRRKKLTLKENVEKVEQELARQGITKPTQYLRNLKRQLAAEQLAEEQKQEGQEQEEPEEYYEPEQYYEPDIFKETEQPIKKNKAIENINKILDTSKDIDKLNFISSTAIKNTANDLYLRGKINIDQLNELNLKLAAKSNRVINENDKREYRKIPDPENVKRIYRRV